MDLWSPHLIRYIIQIEKVQRSFTKFITEMCDCSYSDTYFWLPTLSVKVILYVEETRTLLYNLCLENNRGLGTKFFQTYSIIIIIFI